MKLKLTNREKLLLIIFVICLAAAILYYAAVKPQLDMVNKLERQTQEYSTEISDIKSKASLDNPIYGEYEELLNRTKSLLQRYYPEIIQEKFILLLNEKINKTNIKVVKMNFQEPEFVELKARTDAEEIEESELESIVKKMNNHNTSTDKDQLKKTLDVDEPLKVKKMTVSLTLQGSYNQIYDFLKEIEQENRSIVLMYIDMKSNGSDNISCELVLDFYAVPKPFEQADEYLKWDKEGEYGRENPFR